MFACIVFGTVLGLVVSGIAYLLVSDMDIY